MVSPLPCTRVLLPSFLCIIGTAIPPDFLVVSTNVKVRKQPQSIVVDCACLMASSFRPRAPSGRRIAEDIVSFYDGPDAAISPVRKLPRRRSCSASPIKGEDAAVIRSELAEVMDAQQVLQERRLVLEERRRTLLEASIPPCHHRRRSASAMGSGRMQTHGLSCAEGRPAGKQSSAAPSQRPFGDRTEFLSETARRREQPNNACMVAKRAMQSSYNRESCCVMGDFLLEDNARVYTFGRAPRFVPIVGRQGAYHLRGTRPLDPSGGTDGTPGPGAYTPRYNKASKPLNSSFCR